MAAHGRGRHRTRGLGVRERGYGDDRKKWRDGDDRKCATRRCQANHKRAEHIEHRMSREHVREETNRKADRTRQERDDLDRHHDGQHIARHAGRHEKLEEAETVLEETV